MRICMYYRRLAFYSPATRFPSPSHRFTPRLVAPLRRASAAPQVLVLFASLVGLIGSTTLLHPTGLFGIRLEILLTGNAQCAAMLVIQFGAAYVFGTFVNDTRHLAFFAIGAICAGG